MSRLTLMLILIIISFGNSMRILAQEHPGKRQVNTEMTVSEELAIPEYACRFSYHDGQKWIQLTEESLSSDESQKNGTINLATDRLADQYNLEWTMTRERELRTNDWTTVLTFTPSPRPRPGSTRHVTLYNNLQGSRCRTSGTGVASESIELRLTDNMVNGKSPSRKSGTSCILGEVTTTRLDTAKNEINGSLMNFKSECTIRHNTQRDQQRLLEQASSATSSKSDGRFDASPAR